MGLFILLFSCNYYSAVIIRIGAVIGNTMIIRLVIPSSIIILIDKGEQDKYKGLEEAANTLFYFLHQKRQNQNSMEKTIQGTEGENTEVTHGKKATAGVPETRACGTRSDLLLSNPLYWDNPTHHIKNRKTKQLVSTKG